MPLIVFFTKIGVNISFQCSYQASFNEDTIFPFARRATATGLSQFVARSITILAPLCAELDRPFPNLILIGITVLGLGTSFTLASVKIKKPIGEDIKEFKFNYASNVPKSQKLLAKEKG